MKIYLSHPSIINYKTDLYDPIINSDLYKEHEFIFPHLGKVVNTKEAIKNCDLFIVDISEVSTGSGIEIGWADALGKEIIAIHREDTVPSSSIKFITNKIFSYKSSTELINTLKIILK